MGKYNFKKWKEKKVKQNKWIPEKIYREPYHVITYQKYEK